MASGRLASDVLPPNQSKKIYTNSTGGPVTANVHLQALSNTANACLSIKAINNCSVTSTSLDTAVAEVCNFVGQDSTLSCCGICRCSPQLNTYFNESDNSICGITESGTIFQCTGESIAFGFIPACRVKHLHYTSSTGCTFFPEHYNGGNDNASLGEYAKVCDVHGGRGVICGAHPAGYFPRRGGTTYSVPDINCPTRIFPCFNWVLGFTRQNCCCYGGGTMCCFSFSCSCGAHHKTTLTKACYFDGKTPDCIMCHQIVDSCRSMSTLLRSVCHQYAATSACPSNLAFVAFEPYMGTTIVLSSGIGAGWDHACSPCLWEQTFSGDFGEDGSSCPGQWMTCSCAAAACRLNCLLCNGFDTSQPYQPFLVTNGAAIRNTACNCATSCAGPALLLWEPGTSPCANGLKELTRSLDGGEGNRTCGCISLFWCLGCSCNAAIKWLQWNPTDNNIYMQYVVCGEGGIFTLNWEGGNPTAVDNSIGVVTGSSGYDMVSDPVKDLHGTFCCKCVCYTDLPAPMQNGVPIWFQHMAKDCFVGNWGGTIYRSSDLLTWTTLDCYVGSKVPNATQFQENPENNSCYFSTDDTCYCYSKNLYNELPCTGIFEYCVSANQLERSGIVLSDNDSLYVNNESEIEVSSQVYGYEDN